MRLLKFASFAMQSVLKINSSIKVPAIFPSVLYFLLYIIYNTSNNVTVQKNLDTYFCNTITSKNFRISNLEYFLCANNLSKREK